MSSFSLQARYHSRLARFCVAMSYDRRLPLGFGCVKYPWQEALTIHVRLDLVNVAVQPGTELGVRGTGSAFAHTENRAPSSPWCRVPGSPAPRIGSNPGGDRSVVLDSRKLLIILKKLVDSRVSRRAGDSKTNAAAC